MIIINNYIILRVNSCIGVLFEYVLSTIVVKGDLIPGAICVSGVFICIYLYVSG